MKSKKKLAAKWAEAQMRCRLSDEGVQLAKESGITPQVLLRKIPHESEPWNQPVESWVRTVYMKKEGEGVGQEKLKPSDFRRGSRLLV